MRVAVFGSTGRVGASVVRQALEAGHDVSAFARASSVGKLPSDVKAHKGELDDAQAIAQCIAGSDAVISALGLRQNSADQVPVLLGAYTHICRAMAVANVKRLVAISGSGTRLPGEPVTLGRGMLRAIMKLLDRHVLQANEAAAIEIIGTDLDWILVRPPRIKDGDATGNRAADSKATPSMQISVGDVAAFMLEFACSEEWVRKAPFVAATRT